MADANEDSIRAPAPRIPADDSSDEEDSPQDFRFLSVLTSSRTGSSIPKRGLKDFEPDPSKLQSSTLAASRQAMHSALSHTRVHAPKAHVVGLFDKKTGRTKVRKAKGSMFKSIGCGTPDGGVELLPEEALWALERGSLDVRWPVDVRERELQFPILGEKDNGATETDANHSDIEEDLEEEEHGIPMSLQGAYAAFIGEEDLRGGSLTLERYLVYAGLKRSGFIVLRAEGFDQRPGPGKTSVSRDLTTRSVVNLYTWLHALIVRGWSEKSTLERQRTGPLVKPGLYRNYDEIYRLMSIIPSGHNLPRPTSDCVKTAEPLTQHPFTTTFNVHKALPNYRKTTPGTPSFRICVVSARDTRVPTLAQLTELLDEQNPSDAAAATIDKAALQMSVPAMYKRLRQDGRHVILAVVDEGVTSYMRVSEAGFSEERVYERVGRGGKRGGGSGRGRGGGRGGRGRGGRGRG